MYSQSEYLELERTAAAKSEYYKGEVFAMAGGSLPHNKIAGNFYFILRRLLAGKNCQPFGSDMRVHIPLNTLYTYPDISVVCGKEELLDDKFDTLLNPVFIAEVLSKTTRDYDTGGKFAFYRSIETLREYWTVSSYEYNIQKWVKNSHNHTWVLNETSAREDSMKIESLKLNISLPELYEQVAFEE